MAKLYVSEYARMKLDSLGKPYGPEGPPITTQVLDTAGTHLSATFNAETRFIRLCADGVVSYKIAATPTAATSDERLPANWVDYIGLAAPVSGGSGLKIDCIANT